MGHGGWKIGTRREKNWVTEGLNIETQRDEKMRPGGI